MKHLVTTALYPDDRQSHVPFAKFDPSSLMPYARPTAKAMLGFLANLTDKQRRFAILEVPRLLNLWVTDPSALGLKSKRPALAAASSEHIYAQLDALAVALFHWRRIYVKDVPFPIWRAFQFSPEKDPKLAVGAKAKLSTKMRAMTSWTDGIENAAWFVNAALNNAKPTYIFEATSKATVLATPESARLMIGDLSFCAFAFPDLSFRSSSGKLKVSSLDPKNLPGLLRESYDLSRHLHDFNHEREVLVYSTNDVPCVVAAAYRVADGEDNFQFECLPKYKSKLRRIRVLRPATTLPYGYDKRKDKDMKAIDEAVRQANKTTKTHNAPSPARPSNVKMGGGKFKKTKH